VSASIPLRPEDRIALLRHYHSSSGPAVRLRCHVHLLLDAGHSWSLIAAVLFTSSAAIDRWRRACARDETQAVLAPPAPRTFGRWWVGIIVRWALALAPSDFGFARSRWTFLLTSPSPGARPRRRRCRWPRADPAPRPGPRCSSPGWPTHPPDLALVEFLQLLRLRPTRIAVLQAHLGARGGRDRSMISGSITVPLRVRPPARPPARRSPQVTHSRSAWPGAWSHGCFPG
jgi:hypothetical protein